MPSVKISELPVLSQFTANNANTVFVVVDKTTNTTSQFVATSLITGVLANSTFTNTQANTIIIQGVDLTQNTRLSSIETINTNQNTSISIIEGVDATQNTRLTTAEANISIIQSVDATQNTRLNSIETINTNQNNTITIIQGVDATQNTRLTTAEANISIIQSVDVTQNTRLDSIETINTNQNTSITIIQGVDLTQNARLTTAEANISIIQGVDVTQNTRLNSIETINTNQNTSISIIEGVDATQNTRLTIAEANISIIQSVDANTRLNSIETINTNQNNSITIIQGVDLTQNARLTTAEANISIIEGVDATQNTRLNSIETINTNQNTSISIIEGVDATQNTRLNSIETINTNQNNSITIIQGVDLTQNADIIAINNYANSAFAKANAALANSSGTFAGDLTITGDLTVIDNTTTNTAVILERITFNNNALIRTLTGSGNQKDITILTGNELSDNESGDITLQTGTAPINATGGNISLIPGVGGLGRGTINLFANTVSNGTVTIQNSTFNPNTSLMSITASDNFATVAPSNTNYMLHVTGKANSVTRVVLDSFGANTYALLSGRMGRGSAAAPAAVANNDVMMRIVGNGYTGTTFPSSSPTKIDFVAAENFSDTNRGSRIEFWNTPIGSNTIQKIASFNADSVTFTGVVNPVKGFIFTPRLPVGNQTTIAIDFTNDVIIKANLAADLTVTLSNFVFGKVVEVWLTNTSGLTRTITHGCSSINSSVNATTFTMPSTSSAYLRYFSIDGDLANTFVAIQSA